MLLKEREKGREGDGEEVSSYGINETTRYCNLEQESMDRNLWRTRFKWTHGPVARQTKQWTNKIGYKDAVYVCERRKQKHAD